MDHCDRWLRRRSKGFSSVGSSDTTFQPGVCQQVGQFDESCNTAGFVISARQFSKCIILGSDDDAFAF